MVTATMTIAFHTHDARWARLRPSLRKAVLHCFHPSLESDLKRAQHGLAGDKSGSATPHGFAKPNPALPWGKDFLVTMVLTNDTEIRALNRQYRRKNKPTNVLSFPDGAQLEGVTQLGDVVLSYDTLKAEAQAQKKSLKNHAIHLVIHGTLHLLGFDHETDCEAAAMEALEIKILARMGIANPYENE